MRYFLMFYLNLGIEVRWELVLLILSKFSFLSISHSFLRTSILLLYNLFSKIALHVFFLSSFFSVTDINSIVYEFIWTKKVAMHSCPKRHDNSHKLWRPPFAVCVNGVFKDWERVCHSVNKGGGSAYLGTPP